MGVSVRVGGRRKGIWFGNCGEDEEWERVVDEERSSLARLSRSVGEGSVDSAGLGRMGTQSTVCANSKYMPEIPYFDECTTRFHIPS